MHEHPLLHSALVPVRWGDMDSYGHVNNTVYLQYVEEVRCSWFASVGIDINHDSQGPVVLQNLHTYLRPVVYPATVRVELRVLQIGNSSLTLGHRLNTQEAPDTLRSEGHCKLVWVDHADNRSIPLPESLRAHLQRYLPS